MRAWILAAVLAAVGTGCGTGSWYLRPALECSCEHNFAGKCRCLHCVRGAEDPRSKCYCGIGSCECGLQRPGCACDHCTGKPGGEQCRCGTTNR